MCFWHVAADGSRLGYVDCAPLWLSHACSVSFVSVLLWCCLEALSSCIRSLPPGRVFEFWR